MTDPVLDTNKSLEDLVRTVLVAKGNMGAWRKELTNTAAALKRQDEALNKAVKSIISNRKATIDLTKAYLKQRQAVKDKIALMAKEKQAEDRVARATEELTKKVERMSKGYVRFFDDTRKVAGGAQKLVGVLGKVGTSLGAQALSFDNVIKSVTKYNQGLFDLTLKQQESGKGMADFDRAIRKVSKDTVMSKNDFLSFANSMTDLYLGVKPTNDAMADMAATLQTKFGPNVDLIKSKMEALMGIQNQFPAMYDDIEKAAKTKDEAERKRMQLMLVSKAQAMGMGQKEQDLILQMTAKTNKSQQSLLDTNRDIASVTKSSEDAMLAMGQSSEKVIQKMAQSMEGMYSILEKIPEIAAVAAVAIAALSSAGASGFSTLLTKIGDINAGAAGGLAGAGPGGAISAGGKKAMGAWKEGRTPPEAGKSKYSLDKGAARFNKKVSKSGDIILRSTKKGSKDIKLSGKYFEKKAQLSARRLQSSTKKSGNDFLRKVQKAGKAFVRKAKQAGGGVQNKGNLMGKGAGNIAFGKGAKLNQSAGANAMAGGMLFVQGAAALTMAFDKNAQAQKELELEQKSTVGRLADGILNAGDNVGLFVGVTSDLVKEMVKNRDQQKEQKEQASSIEKQGRAAAKEAGIDYDKEHAIATKKYQRGGGSKGGKDAKWENEQLSVSLIVLKKLSRAKNKGRENDKIQTAEAKNQLLAYNTALANQKSRLMMADKMTNALKEQISIAESFGMVDRKGLESKKKSLERQKQITKETTKAVIGSVQGTLKESGVDMNLNLENKTDSEQLKEVQHGIVKEIDAQMKAMEGFNDALAKTTSKSAEEEKILKDIETTETKISALRTEGIKASEQSLALKQAEAAAVNAMFEESYAGMKQMEQSSSKYEARLEAQRSLMESAQFGMGASVEMMQKQVDLAYKFQQEYQQADQNAQDMLHTEQGIDKALIEQVKNAETQGDAQKDIEKMTGLTGEQQKALSKYAEDHQEIQTKSMKQQQKIYDLTKNIREGYLDAMREMSAGAGEFSKIIGTQDMGVTQLMDTIQDTTGRKQNTMGYGGTQTRAQTGQGLGTRVSGEHTTSGMDFNQSEAENARITGYKKSKRETEALMDGKFVNVPAPKVNTGLAADRSRSEAAREASGSRVINEAPMDTRSISDNPAVRVSKKGTFSHGSVEKMKRGGATGADAAALGAATARRIKDPGQLSGGFVSGKHGKDIQEGALKQFGDGLGGGGGAASKLNVTISLDAGLAAAVDGALNVTAQIKKKAGSR